MFSNHFIKIRSFLLFAVSFLSVDTFAQKDSSSKITFSAYGELYYSYDFSEPANHEKSSFLYNHKRHNEINANLLMLKAAYNDKKYRANLALMYGNFPQYNMAAEPSWARNIYEANVGVRLSEKQKIWIYAGIMPSHIGFESAISADCWTLTRSLLAENSPYYEAGIKLSYASKRDKWNFSLLYLNGWQRIQKPDFIQRPSFGMQATYKPNNKFMFNYSNFIGTDKPDSMNAFRHFHNLYLQYEPSEKLGIIAGFDIGSEKINKTKNGIWYSPVFILRHQIKDKFRVAVRGEYYHDQEQIIIFTGIPAGFRTYGVSSNFDVDLSKHIQLRVEGKMLQSRDKIFPNNMSNNYSVTTNLTIKL
jgi:hypothetical protein